MIPDTNSEGCLELLTNLPLQQYESEITLIFLISVFAILVMVILLGNHIKNLSISWKVFPFISLTLTPLVVLHMFIVDVNLAEVVKLLTKRLFQILSYDFFDMKSAMDGPKLAKPSFSLMGYTFLSLVNNMGIVFWLVILFIITLLLKWASYLFNEKVDRLRYSFVQNFYESLYNYLATSQIISLTCLVLYVRYEYVETGCFDVTCFLSDVSISATKIVKLDIVVSILLIIGSL